jgi:hypothetical protein
MVSAELLAQSIPASTDPVARPSGVAIHILLNALVSRNGLLGNAGLVPSGFGGNPEIKRSFARQAQLFRLQAQLFRLRDGLQKVAASCPAENSAHKNRSPLLRPCLFRIHGCLEWPGMQNASKTYSISFLLVKALEREFHTKLR